ncbi:MAG: hypothetical protein IJN08_03840, partial [Clostridia bacterium]|nr:hypothetical protein [Clostridia bacterium]
AIAFFEDISNQYAYAFPLNGDWDTFFNDTFRDSDWEMWLCATETGVELYLDIAWEDPKPDVTKAGVVMVTGQPILPEGMTLELERIARENKVSFTSVVVQCLEYALDNIGAGDTEKA